jgi:hypothetical protein
MRPARTSYGSTTRRTRAHQAVRGVEEAVQLLNQWPRSRSVG